MKKLLISTVGLLFPLVLFAQTATVPVYLVAEDGKGKSVGTVDFIDTSYGMLIKTHLDNLTPGNHGFHIHANPSCADNGTAAGGHLAGPANSDAHNGPFSDKGHLGDLPVLWVAKNREANDVLVAPRLKVSDLSKRSVMIHAKGDNYSDKPNKLGGGGDRVACGVIKASLIKNN